MAIDYVMPKLAMAMNQGTINEWMVAEGPARLAVEIVDDEDPWPIGKTDAINVGRIAHEGLEATVLTLDTVGVDSDEANVEPRSGSLVGQRVARARHRQRRLQLPDAEELRRLERNELAPEPRQGPHWETRDPARRAFTRRRGVAERWFPPGRGRWK